MLGRSDDPSTAAALLERWDRFTPADRTATLAVLGGRPALALPLPPREQASAHLAIAMAYLAVSVQEREAALAVIQRHGLDEQFHAEFERLRQAFHRSQSRHEQLAQLWRERAGDLLQADARAAVLTHLLNEGALGRSQYATLCAVGPTTASKHLGLLAARGLLIQIGRGPSTSYRLEAGH